MLFINVIDDGIEVGNFRISRDVINDFRIVDGMFAIDVGLQLHRVRITDNW